ncbi:hypothetical protein QBC32DRAFT_2094 [Pseudoneurospora amorphoporcata]|uniref:Uncharacterized protein n=1 Tax=Pseudoneurospora amorphoporcata TaxID=241081 RepID=A0AAN6P3K9_9PEZI|nr:hypothetical protein QBC32DRAFT_2094 [Pseudoneurospora amorphoporcata]
MRFTPLILTGLFALAANAQSTTTTSASAPLNSEQAAIIKCIEACQEGDVSCTSKCIAVPNPSDQDVNDTNDCVTACPKGNGTESDNAKYQSCVEDCIGQHYFSATTGAGGGGAANPTSPATTTTTGVTRTNVVVVSTVVSGSFTTTVTSTSTPPSAEEPSSGGGDDSKATSTSTVESTRSAGAAAGRGVAVGGLGGFLLGVVALL